MQALPASFVLLLALATSAAADYPPPAGSEGEQLRGIVTELLRDNAAFVRAHDADYFKAFADRQQPRATVVSCADSRVHEPALSQTPDNDLFMVRDIGNQIATAEGSVEYGVRHLRTPLLIVVGHVACGAIKTVQDGYAKEPPAIRRELAAMRLPARDPGHDEHEAWLHGVQANVNNQVAYALRKFAPEVAAGRLTVLGTVYDFQNAMQQGQGRLLIINVNGATDTAGLLTRLLQISGSGTTLQTRVVTKAADNKTVD